MSARILVVDDILPNVKLLEAKLMSAYYEVITATSGQEALDKANATSPDIILLDVMMPGMDGFEVCQKLKSNPHTSHIPVVMVTALTEPTDRVRGLQAGADDFLSKPLNDTALMARVRSLVRLKMTIDEWRIRENTANTFGVTDQAVHAMSEPVTEARVLVIEDQGFESDKLVETLAQDDDIVMVAGNGLDAIDMIAKNDFELIIVSLNLDNEDGLRLCSHLKSSEKTRNVPILMVSEEMHMERVASGLEIGAHDYILRPIDRNELLARCRTQIRRKRFNDRLRSNYEVSLSMALTDTLTGLYNRRYLETHLVKLLQKSYETNKPLAVLIMDIDYFKKVNDTYGHKVGDEVLKEFAARLNSNLRSFDLVVRLGGEEFVAILPDVSDERAMNIAERTRRAICEKPFKISAEPGYLDISTSIGGAIIRAGEQVDVDECLNRADKELYAAKEGGRNRVYFENVGPLDPEKFKLASRPIIE